MFVLGVDIGYSNLKLAIGQSGSEPKTIILPAGAGPADRMPERIGGGDDETCLYVSVDNERWAAGVPAGRNAAQYPASRRDGHARRRRGAPSRSR